MDKKRSLTIIRKIEVLDKVKSGVPRSRIIAEYNISADYLYRIQRREDSIRAQSESFEFKNKRRYRSSNNLLVERALEQWFYQKRALGVEITGPILRDQALVFNKSLGGPTTFKASSGWLQKFSKRHGIRFLRTKGEKLSSDGPAADDFKKIFQKRIEDENLPLCNIYNADESGIYWKMLYNFTLVSFKESSVSGRKQKNERYTALFCANASGTHQIPLLCIGKSKCPRSMKNSKCLPISYDFQTKAWMNKGIFLRWYQNEFIPQVLEHQRATGAGGRVILLLDNAPSHPKLEELNKIHANFEVVYLPPNVTATIQPMNQGIIATTKKLYKKFLLRKMLIGNDGFGGPENFLNKYTIRDSFEILGTIWLEMKKSTLSNTWKPLLGNLISPPANSTSVAENITENSVDMTALFDQAYEQLQEHDPTLHDREKARREIEEWLNRIDGDCGWEHFSDEEIIAQVLSNHTTSEECTTVEDDSSQSSSSFEDNEEGDDTEVSDQKALESLLTFEKWLKNHPDCTKAHLDSLEILKAMPREGIPHK